MWSLNDMQIAAKNVLTKHFYASFRTGALDEVTYQANLNIWKNVRLNGYKLSGLLINLLNIMVLEEIANVALNNQVMFHQEYIWSNKSPLADELKRIEAAGYKAIFFTVDNTGINGIRTRSLRYTGTMSPSLHDATFDLATLSGIRNLTSLPIVPKGIKTAADALTCLKLAFLLSMCPTTAGVTLMNAPEVFQRMEACADGGVRRGNHVITLFALGAMAVGLGRSPIFANIWGEEGVSRMIEMLQTELKTTMQLMGKNKVANINSSYVNTKLVESVYFGN
ncbi:FMN-dependent alpha-hydroxy acid dehydrogenase [Desarmillaria ectypa]|nr:FMN-dependent alpha-hydroxy acid dehydrogenase [Desarmillaria ectypa]